MAWACAPLRGRGVLRPKGSAQRGSWMTTRGKDGAPGGASGSTRWSQNCAVTMRGTSRVPPCQVSRRAGGVAAHAPPRGPWQRTDHGALRRAASRATVRRQRGTSRRTVGWTTTDIPQDACRVDRGQWDPPIRHADCVGGHERWRLLEQRSLQGGCSWLVGCDTHELAGHGQALGRQGAEAGREAHGGRRQCLAGRRPGVLRRTPSETRTPETHQVTGDWAVAPMPVRLPLTVVLDHLRPGGQEPRGVPATISKRSNSHAALLWRPAFASTTCARRT